jgi:hypothetical protein
VPWEQEHHESFNQKQFVTSKFQNITQQISHPSEFIKGGVWEGMKRDVRSEDSRSIGKG